MRVVSGTIIVLAALLMIAFPVKAFTITETDFTIGEYSHTESGSGSLRLSLISPAEYYMGGNFTSQVFDAGLAVNWTFINWTATINASKGQSVKLQVRTGNSSTVDSSWTSFSQNYTAPQGVEGVARYVQFAAHLQTADNTSTPLLDEVVLTYEKISPQVQLLAPPNNYMSSTRNISFNCSVSSANQLTNITFFSTFSGGWAPNGTIAVSGSQVNASFSFSDIADGTYLWNCKAEDQTGAEASSPINHTIIVSATNSPPTIMSFNITPQNVENGSQVLLGIAVADATGVDAVWAAIRYPNNSEVNITLVNNDIVGFNVSLLGNYLVTFFANDTAGKISSAQGSFKVSPMIAFTFTAQNNAQGAVTANVTVLKGGTVVVSKEIQGAFSSSIIEDSYDVRVKAFDQLEVTFRGVSITYSEVDKILGLDTALNLHGFPVIYAVSNPYAITSGGVRIIYDETLFTNESRIDLFRCSSWNFTSRACNGNFTPIVGYSQSTVENSIEVNVTGFSSFALQQGGFCGDGVCSGSENNQTCIQDCECQEGKTQRCGATDVGECSYGTQVCTNGKWGSCVNEVQSVSETCNQKDDDCDGSIDNVGAGSSIETAKCQCFDGNQPQEEICNNVDDDCDGQVDGMSKACGSNIGICREGVQVCTAGVYEECSGGVEAQSEVCDNGEDENCDGQNDEDCPNCFNQVKDGNEEGVDCGGSCAAQCQQFPVTIIGGIGAVLALILVIVYKFRHKVTWTSLEKRYSYKPK